MILTQENNNKMNDIDSDYSHSEIEDDVAMSDNDGDAETDNQELPEGDNESEDNNEEIDAQNSRIKHNPGWADAMAKILNTNNREQGKTIVLAKAKKLKPNQQYENKDDHKVTFEIDGEENEEKTKIKVESEVKTKEQIRLDREKRVRKKLIEAKGRVKPLILEREREKVLTKVATKGVVQLFNAVRQQQKSIEIKKNKVGPTKHDQVLKSVDKQGFLDVLMSAKSETVPEVKEEPSSQWSVLRDDFLMSSKCKDWDKEDDDSKIECE